MKKIFTFLAFLSFIYAAHAQYSITYETIDPVCNGQCNGKIKITGASGGMAPYTLKLLDYYQNILQTITNYNGTSLIYFEDAEKEPMPKMLKQVSWSEIKTFFTKEVKRIIKI